MNPTVGESKGVCQQCGGPIAFPTAMEGENVTCPHCGWETTLIDPAFTEILKSVTPPTPLLDDPDWPNRAPAGLKLPLKALHGALEVIVGLGVVATWGIAFVIFVVVVLRLLHAAWGH